MAKYPMIDEIASLRRLADDLERICAGTAPSADDLSAAPILDRWEVAFTAVAVLIGDVTGHPDLAGHIQTDQVCALDPDRRWVRTLWGFYQLRSERLGSFGLPPDGAGGTPH